MKEERDRLDDNDLHEAEMKAAKAALIEKAKIQGDHMSSCTSYISRTLGVGYNRSARIMEALVAEQFITDADETGKRALKQRGET